MSTRTTKISSEYLRPLGNKVLYCGQVQDRVIYEIFYQLDEAIRKYPKNFKIREYRKRRLFSIKE